MHEISQEEILVQQTKIQQTLLALQGVARNLENTSVTLSEGASEWRFELVDYVAILDFLELDTNGKTTGNLQNLPIENFQQLLETLRDQKNLLLNYRLVLKQELNQAETVGSAQKAGKVRRQMAVLDDVFQLNQELSAAGEKFEPEFEKIFPAFSQIKEAGKSGFFKRLFKK